MQGHGNRADPKPAAKNNGARVKSSRSSSTSLLGVSRALQTLLLFRKSPELGVREIARRLDINSAAAHRTITTLSEYGFLEYLSDSRTYALGHSIAELGEVMSSSRGFSQIAIDLMTPLRDETKETVALHEVASGMRNCILSLDSPLALRMIVPTGLKIRITNGAVDLIFRAFGSAEECAEIDARLASLTAPSADELLYGAGLGHPPREKEIEEVRRRGWAVSHGVRTLDSLAIAAPLILNGKTYALALFGPHDRVERLDVEKQAHRLMEVAADMARALKGLRPGPSL